MVSTVDLEIPRAVGVEVDADALMATLADGRVIAAPLAWFPQLLHADADERRNWRLIGDGLGVHWPDLDEDVSIEGLLAGGPSSEGPQSLQRWPEARQAPERVEGEGRGGAGRRHSRVDGNLVSPLSPYRRPLHNPRIAATGSSAPPESAMRPLRDRRIGEISIECGLILPARPCFRGFAGPRTANGRNTPLPIRSATLSQPVRPPQVAPQRLEQRLRLVPP